MRGDAPQRSLSQQALPDPSLVCETDALQTAECMIRSWLLAVAVLLLQQEEEEEEQEPTEDEDEEEDGNGAA